MTPIYTVPLRPTRDVTLRQLRFFPAVAAASIAAIVFLAIYYLTLGLLPGNFEYSVSSALWPVPAWAHRFDLAQFLGTLIWPPYPTAYTWIIGLVLMIGTLVGLGIVYALLLSWVQERSDAVKGLGFGLAGGVGLVLLISFADGLHPALMRNALMDPGVFLVGWSFWAPFQLLLAHAVYGLILGHLYGRR